MTDSADSEQWEARAMPTPPGFVEVRDARGRLLFLYDATRDLVQIKPKGEPAVLIDLRIYRTHAQGKAI